MAGSPYSFPVSGGGLRHRAVVGGMVLMAASGFAWGQRIITAVDPWAHPALPGPVLSGTGAGTAAAENAGGGRGALLLRAEGSAQENGDNVEDSVRIAFSRYTQTFTTGRNGDIVVPMLADGLVSFGGFGQNPAVFDIEQHVELWRRDGAGVWQRVGGPISYSQRFDNLLPIPIDQLVSHTRVARFGNMAAGEYRVEAWALFHAVANALPGVGALGTDVRFDFFDRTQTPERTLIFSLSAEPPNYAADSRDQVRAPQARARFGVDGTNARVGIVEPGQAFRNHAHYAGRITIQGGTAGEREADEHATAVAGIIGANAGDGHPGTGVAPGAQMVSAPVTRPAPAGTRSFIDAATAIRDQWGMGTPGIINLSASGGTATNADLDRFLVANPRITWVSSAGNAALTNPGTIPAPNHAYNNIAVGALDGTFGMPADFSSNSAGQPPSKPDIVAPGEYILSASLRDINNNGHFDDYTRSFLGANPGQAPGVVTGGVAGTSFAAPHVTGTVALMHDYRFRHQAQFDDDSLDRRVMKAVLLTAASTRNITHRPPAGGGPPASWHQARTGTGAQGQPPISVPRSLDVELGAGKLDAEASVALFAAGEVRQSDNNTEQHAHVFGPGNAPIFGPSATRTAFWDLEQVQPRAGGRDGTVDYIVGSIREVHYIAELQVWAGRVRPNFEFLRSALTWNRTVDAAGAYDPLDRLELRLFLDGLESGNQPGFDPLNPNADILIAATNEPDANVKLLDLSTQDIAQFTYNTVFGAVPPLAWDPMFYLQVANLSGNAVTYGVAVMIPTPAAAVVLMAWLGLGAIRRRGAAACS